MSEAQLEALLSGIESLAAALMEQAQAIGVLARAVAEQNAPDEGGFDSLDG